MSSGFANLIAAAIRAGAPPDVDRAKDILIPEILLFTLATIAVFARLYVRLRVRPKLWWDDWTMFIAYAWAIFGLTTIILQIRYGLGRHAIYIGEDNTILAIKWNQFARLTFIPTMALIKMSICFFLLRILDPRTHPHFRIYIWLVMAASIVANVVLLVVWAIQCTPLEAVWDPRIEGQCLSQNIVVDIAYVQAGFNLVTDLLCALFPMFFFNTSYMRWRTRGALITLVVLGVITSVTALLRVVYLPELEVQNDATFELTDVTICALIETKAGIFLTCLPAIKCLWTISWERLSVRLTGNRNQTSKSWDPMESPILPSFDSSGYMQHGASDAVPLRPLAITRDARLPKGYDTPPPTPGFEGSGVKVTSFV